MAIKVMLIEDEEGMRLLLRKIIEKHKEFEIAAECDELAQSVILFQRTRPEVVFLDIGIKGQSGIDCAKILTELDPKVKIIFATAHAEYMPEAFELYAFDYLVKPFNVERADRTLKRIISLEQQEKKFEPEEQIEKPRCRHDRLLVKGKESMSFIPISDIVLIQRENHATIIYTEKDSYATSASLSELEKKLDKEQFLRSHKSYIINLSRISRIEPYGRWTYVVHFEGRKEDALLTAEKFEEIRRRFV
ncbi:MAG TPA: response regulator transcription factor [Candidatus Choladousia intestinipullorum]|nr:response regulator transcription factor [Candidatus Choladousia intestinipullorum]